MRVYVFQRYIVVHFYAIFIFKRLHFNVFELNVKIV